MSSRSLRCSYGILFVFLLFLACLSGPGCSSALAQSYVFGTGSFAVTGASPGAMATGDFNHDGKLDLAVANQNGTSPATVSVLLGRPDGSFAPKVDYSLGSLSPTCIAVGDFNGDGNLDLAVGVEFPPTIEILTGKGDGTFNAPVSFQVTSATSFTGLVAGDFNHDGKVDLAAADVATNQEVTVMLGNGDGTFQSGVDYATGGSQSILAADFNNDGNLDLAVAGGLSVSLLLGNGDGTFKPYVPVSVPGGGGIQIAAGDLNGDGRLDLVAAPNGNVNSGGIAVLLGNGDGTFQAAVPYSVLPLDTGTQAVAIGDFDGDGKLDIAAANYGGNDVSIFKGNGDGTFQNPVDYGAGISPEELIPGDFNGDGHLDLAVSGGYVSGSVTVLLGTGAGTFTTWKDYATAGIPQSDTLAGDFNGDGNLDIASTVSAASGSISVLLGKGDGTFQSHVDTPLGVNPSYAATGDFNHDGKLDLVVSSLNIATNAAEVSTLLGNGDGTFTDAFNMPVPFPTGNIVVADFNNDGNLDLATVQENSSAVSVFLGKGDGSFAPPVQYTTGTTVNYGTVFTADFNNDGNADLAVHIAAGTNWILLGNGDGTFQPAVNVFPATATSPDYSISAVGDFNGDGKTDLVITGGFTIYIAFGNGDGTFQPLSAGAVIPESFDTTSPITGDFNNDGKLDLAFTTSPDDAVSILLGNGDGTFGNRIDYLTENSLRDPVAGDFTGDGSLDLAVPHALPNQGGDVSVYLDSPVAALNPAALVFASQPEGTASSSQNVTLFNSGSSPLSIASISTSGDYSETNTCGTKLTQAANCQVSVTFTPTGGGLRSGQIVLDDNAPGSPQTVALSGTGTAPTASVTPTTLSFSSESVGSTSTTQSVKLSNTSNAVLSISSITTGGDFAQSNNCGTSVAAGASCTINVTFTPTAGGSRTGTLSIADNASNSPQIASLSGTGADFTLAVASGSSSSATVSAGGSANYTLTLTPQGGFNQAVSFTCTSSPSGPGCTVSPSSVTLDGSNTATVKVTATTTAASRLLPPNGPMPPLSPWPEVLLLAALGLTGLALRPKARNRATGPRRLRWTMIAGLLLLATGMAACGGGGSMSSSSGSPSNPGTTAGTYTLTVTGASGSLKHSTTLNLNVQ